MRKELKNILPYYSFDKKVVNLSANENHYSDWLDMIKLDKVIDSNLLANYGPDFYYDLIKKYALLNNIDYKCVISAPGSDSFISVLINALTTKSIILLKQDFFRYEEIARVLNRKNYLVDYEDGYIDKLINLINNESIELLILSNPNNPLGIRHNQEDLLKILENTNAYIVIDEAYYEYQDQSMIKYIEKYPKLIITRTLSKAWGLAGLRCTFTIAEANLIQYLYAIQGPFTLSIINANIAFQVLDYEDVMKDMVKKTNENKEMFKNLLKELNIELAYPSYTNFIYLKIENAKEIRDILYDKYNYAINYFEPNGLRITIGTKDEMIKLSYILKNLL